MYSRTRSLSLLFSPSRSSIRVCKALNLSNPEFERGWPLGTCGDVFASVACVGAGVPSPSSEGADALDDQYPSLLLASFLVASENSIKFPLWLGLDDCVDVTESLGPGHLVAVGLGRGDGRRRPSNPEEVLGLRVSRLTAFDRDKDERRRSLKDAFAAPSLAPRVKGRCWGRELDVVSQSLIAVVVVFRRHSDGGVKRCSKVPGINTRAHLRVSWKPVDWNEDSSLEL